MRPLVWFRSDLRLRDNPALYHACRDETHGVLAVFVITPQQWRSHDWGKPKVEFVLRSTAALSASLAARNIPLAVLRADSFDQTPQELLALAKAHECDALYFNREHEVNESRRDADVAETFEREGLRVQTFDDQTVIPPTTVRTKDGGFYSVYTPFRRTWLKLLADDGGPRVLAAPRSRATLWRPPDPTPTHLDGFPGVDVAPELWPAGEDKALRRLKTFIAGKLDRYEDDRDFPTLDGTSALSPYLAVGAISTRQCLMAAIDANDGHVDGGKPGAARWINELIWREFYRHVLVGFPRVCMGRPFRLETESVAWSDNDEHFAAWSAGRTGYPIVDAGMRQLAQTGWMHNRLRMIVAMFLTKDLLIDWRRGERHFMQNLVDADFASNNGGWQWAASTGTDAAPYFRVFNPAAQSRRFDPDGDFIRRFVPELGALDAADVHEPYDAGVADYPPAIIDHAAARSRALAAFSSAK